MESPSGSGPGAAHPDAHPGRQARIRWSLASIFVLVLASRIFLANSKSLVLDEFHSYYHAVQPGLAALTSELREDNHPPLSFLVIGVSRATGLALTGEEPSEMWLRLPALLFGLLEIAAVAAFAGAVARSLGRRGQGPAVLAAALAGASTLHLDYGTQARMYAPLALAITALTMGLWRFIEAPKTARSSGAVIALSVAAAFHVHYFGLQYAAALVAAAILGAAMTGRPERARALVAPVGVALLLCLPWGLGGFSDQLRHELPPGGDDLGMRSLAEAYIHLFVHTAALGGPVFGWVFAAGGGLILASAAVGATALLRERATRVPGLLLATSAFALPLASWLLATFFPRAGFTWHYVLPSTAAAAVLAAIGAGNRVARAAVLVGLALAVCLSALHLTSPATEDFRGAVAFALDAERAAPDDETVRIVAVEWQPALFPQGQPWDYYAPRLADTPPLREPMIPHEFVVQDMERLLAADRVILVRRSLPNDQPLLERLIGEFGPPHIEPFGYGLDVRVFSRTP